MIKIKLFGSLRLKTGCKGLDAQTEDVKTVKDACIGKCVLLVTHDKETLIQCDSVTEL